MHKDPSLGEVIKLLFRELPDACVVFSFPVLASLAYLNEIIITYFILYSILFNIILVYYIKRIIKTQDHQKVWNQNFNFHFLVYLPNFGLCVNSKMNKESIKFSLILMIVFDLIVLLFNLFVYCLSTPTENSNLFHICTLTVAGISLLMSGNELYFTLRSQKSCYDWAFRESFNRTNRDIGRQSSRTYELVSKL